MTWVKRLQAHWKVGSAGQVILILIVFACTGFTVLAIKNPILRFLFGDIMPLWARILYYILILPIYNVLLLFYGFVFGQFHFFWDFEQRSLARMKTWFGKR